MARHQIERIRHETRRRTLTVETITRLTPHMLRIGFVAEAMQEFVSLSPDDHVKLFFTPDGGRGCMRDYTPRRFDTVSGKVAIDFALHEGGVATRWAIDARAGDTLEMGGPRGSAVVPADFDWYLLIGDETALPAIGRWLEEAKSGLPITTMVMVADENDRQDISTSAAWTSIWATTDDAAGEDVALPLKVALAKWRTPPGDGFVWIAAEANVARSVRNHVLDDRRHPREWTKAGGYWVRGEADAHDKLEDDR